VAPPGANREALRQIVKRGSPPGLLAFDAGLSAEVEGVN